MEERLKFVARLLDGEKTNLVYPLAVEAVKPCRRPNATPCARNGACRWSPNSSAG
ncbi:hypothetical protein [Mesorhizobium sp. M0408]|uniref:hypothetical protein n=1 Tax=Mesorhizobium sp. M0408 TaxID=2956942 RepID=UPI00333C8A20